MFLKGLLVGILIGLFRTILIWAREDMLNG